MTTQPGRDVGKPNEHQSPSLTAVVAAPRRGDFSRPLHAIHPHALDHGLWATEVAPTGTGGIIRVSGAPCLLYPSGFRAGARTPQPALGLRQRKRRAAEKFIRPIHPKRVLCPVLQNQAPLSFWVSFTSSESVNP